MKNGTLINLTEIQFNNKSTLYLLQKQFTFFFWNKTFDINYQL